MRYEWDDAKNEANIEKHGYDFIDARELFEGDRVSYLDDRRDYGEPRYVTLGHIGNRFVVAVYTQRLSGTIRIISLRKANNREKERFEKTIRN
jgi:uncharacterized DUF497 family protein